MTERITSAARCRGHCLWPAPTAARSGSGGTSGGSGAPVSPPLGRAGASSPPRRPACGVTIELCIFNICHQCALLVHIPYYISAQTALKRLSTGDFRRPMGQRPRPLHSHSEPCQRAAAATRPTAPAAAAQTRSLCLSILKDVLQYSSLKNITGI